MLDFATAFGAAIDANPTVEPEVAAKVKEILAGHDGLLKRILVRRMEHAAAAHLDEGAGAIDWSKVDWSAVLGFILKILVMILPLL